MRKRLTFIIMAFLLCQGLNAQNRDELRYFNLVLPDNAVVSYELADGEHFRKVDINAFDAQCFGFHEGDARMCPAGR